MKINSCVYIPLFKPKIKHHADRIITDFELKRFSGHMRVAYIDCNFFEVDSGGGGGGLDKKISVAFKIFKFGNENIYIPPRYRERLLYTYNLQVGIVNCLFLVFFL